MPFSINPAGAITGYYVDKNFVVHGFLRAPGGAITSFDVPGAVGTFPDSINPARAITGDYLDASGATHGFVRAPDGTITTFDAPDAISTNAAGINPEGAITGDYADKFSLTRRHGFVRARDGTFTTFDAPDAVNTNFSGFSSINPAGTITGSYVDSSHKVHGFVREPGSIQSFDVPGASQTNPLSINPGGRSRDITTSWVQFRGSCVSPTAPFSPSTSPMPSAPLPAASTPREQ